MQSANLKCLPKPKIFAQTYFACRDQKTILFTPANIFVGPSLGGVEILFYWFNARGPPVITWSRLQRVLGIGLGLVEASEARSLDEAEAMFFSSLLESLYY